MAKRAAVKEPEPPMARMPWPADKIERRPIGDLLPYARNPRLHSDDQVAQIAAAIEEFGWTSAVLVDESGTVIAGHGRILAANKLGLTEVPTMVANGWSEEQKNAYRIWDNQSTLLGEWDKAALSRELSELSKGGYDLEMTGFPEVELKEFLAGLGEAEEADPNKGRVLELINVTINEPKYKVEKGEHFLLDGKHHLFCTEVVTGWKLWKPFLVDEALFCPYAGVFVPLGLKARTHVLIMVQPDPYIAGHILDRYGEANPKKKKAIVRVVAEK